MVIEERARRACTLRPRSEEESAVLANSLSKSKPWSTEEDSRILELVAKHGTKNWAYMETVFPHRSAKQCRERYRNQLDPNIKREPWSEEEDLAIINAVETMGTRWVPIAKLLPGRTDNQIKNHWNSILSKRREEMLRLKAKRDREETEDRGPSQKRCKTEAEDEEHEHEAAQPALETMSSSQMELLDKLLPCQSHLSDSLSSTSEELSSPEDEEDMTPPWSGSPEESSVDEVAQVWEDFGSEEMGIEAFDAPACPIIPTAKICETFTKAAVTDIDALSSCSVGAALGQELLTF